MRALITLLLLALPVSAQEAIKLRPDALVKNVYADGHGVCWFACAATLGKQVGIPCLHDLPAKVLAAKVGHQGADQKSIDHWVNALKLKALHTAEGDKGKESLARIQAWLDRGLPVIMSYRHEKGAHAILVTRISRTKEKWKSQQGNEVEDYAISYYDPDDQKVWRASWEWFYPAWTGRAYTFDPRENPGLVVKESASPPGAKLLPQPRELYAPEKRVLIAHITPGVEWRYELPPYYPHELPYTGEGPPPPGYFKFPSNQDIKDGVTRPNDTFPHFLYGHAGIDYHSEYRKFKAAKSSP